MHKISENCTFLFVNENLLMVVQKKFKVSAISLAKRPSLERIATGWPLGIHVSEDNILYMPGAFAFQVMVPVSERQKHLFTIGNIDRLFHSSPQNLFIRSVKQTMFNSNYLNFSL